MASAAELLALVDEQLKALITAGAEQYSIGSRTVTKIKFDSLMEQRKSLLKQVQRETGSGGISLGRIVGGRR
jgi:hypothetical protein